MLLWVIFAVITAATLVAVLAPIWRAQNADQPPGSAQVAVYLDQLAEVDAESARGLMTVEEAAAARLEIQRRLLRQADNQAGPPAAAPRASSVPRSLPQNAVAVTVLLLVPLAAIATYVALGSPSLPDQPLAARKAAAPEKAQIEMLVARVEERLRTHPEDGQGWDVIAPVYARLGREEQALAAWRQAIRLLGGSAVRWRGLVEASMAVGQGTIDDEAKAALEALAKDEPSDPIPRFWLAIEKEQRGNRSAAIADLEALIAGAPETAPWRSTVAEKLAEMKRLAGSPPDRSSIPAATGPTAADVEAARRMTADEQARMITGMVDSLAARLETNDKDVEGWLRLINAYHVLGRKSDAAVALDKARKALAGDDASLARLSALAKDSGL